MSGESRPLKPLRITLNIIIPVDHDRYGEDQREDAHHCAHWPHQLARARLGLLRSYSSNSVLFSLLPTCFMAIHCPTCLEIWNRDLWLKTEVRWRDSASCLLHGIVHATKPHSFLSRLYINSNLPRFIISCWVSRECECPVIVRVVRIVIVWISSDAKSALFGKTRRFQLMFSFLLHNIVINLRVMHHQLRIF